jgi:hypothetical protein
MVSPAVPATALTLLMAFSHKAGATPITYTFSPDTSLTYYYNTLEDVSGTFTWSDTDPITADITVTGGGPETGTFSTDVTRDGTTGFTVSNSSETFSLSFYFANALDLGASDPLYAGTASNSGSDAYPVTGSADPELAPEPSSLSLLATILGLFGLTAIWRRRGYGKERAA